MWRSDSSGARKESVDAAVAGSISAWEDEVAPVAAGAPTSRGSYRPVEAVTFSPLAGGPGTRFVAKFTPSTIEGLKKQRSAQVGASISVDGKPAGSVASPFQYTATPPVVVLDRHADALVGGSLEVTLVFDVKQLGQELFTVTLFDGTAEIPIALYEGRYLPATLGPQEVKLTFFGRHIAMKAIDGPYVVRALHGTVADESVHPPRVIFSTSTRFTTSAYRAADFSTNEWDSPEKQARIDMFKRLIVETEARKP